MSQIENSISRRVSNNLKYINILSQKMTYFHIICLEKVAKTEIESYYSKLSYFFYFVQKIEVFYKNRIQIQYKWQREKEA